MSHAPPSPCSAPGCPALSVGRYCPGHAHKAGEAGRRYDATTRRRDPRLAQAAAIRNTAQWKRLSARVRAEEPLCRDPFGVHEKAPGITRPVHHIAPLATHPELAFTRSNLAGLCERCHNRIEGMERTGQPTAHLFTTKPIH